MTEQTQPLEAYRQPILVEIAPGELLDKITILEIKAERISDADKLHSVLVGSLPARPPSD